MKNGDSPENGGQSAGKFPCNLEPWTKLVDGAVLLNALTAAIRQHVARGRSRRVVGAPHSRPRGLLDLAAACNHLGANSPSKQAILLRLVS
jgi:hypothetical protein